MKDPDIVVDAITGKEKEVNIYPLTIQKYCFLELLESPFIDNTKKFDVNGVIPAAYVMSRKPEELKKYNRSNIDDLVFDAMMWADSNLDIKDLPDLVKVIISQLEAIDKAAPSGSAENVDPGAKKN